jgi:hypothetical protein
MIRHWPIGILLAGILGCGVSAVKLEESSEHLKRALEAWQAGGKSEELASLATPIEFHEALWNAGEKLVKFEISPARAVESDQLIRCEVRLTVRNRKGKERTEQVVYDITPGSRVKIVNNPMP